MKSILKIAFISLVTLAVLFLAYSYYPVLFPKACPPGMVYTAEVKEARNLLTGQKRYFGGCNGIPAGWVKINNSLGALE